MLQFADIFDIYFFELQYRNLLKLKFTSDCLSFTNLGYMKFASCDYNRQIPQKIIIKKHYLTFKQG